MTIDSVRQKLFSRYRPSQYGIDLDSERIIPGSEFYKTIGGLEYRVLREADRDKIPIIHRVEIIHDKQDMFTIISYTMITPSYGSEPKEHSLVAHPRAFHDLDNGLMFVLRV